MFLTQLTEWLSIWPIGKISMSVTTIVASSTSHAASSSLSRGVRRRECFGRMRLACTELVESRKLV